MPKIYYNLLYKKIQLIYNYQNTIMDTQINKPKLDDTTTIPRRWSQMQPSLDYITYCPKCNLYTVCDDLDSYNPARCRHCLGDHTKIFRGDEKNLHERKAIRMPSINDTTIIERIWGNPSANYITFCPTCNCYTVHNDFDSYNPEICMKCHHKNTRIFHGDKNNITGKVQTN
jgi:hypothetical protein